MVAMTYSKILASYACLNHFFNHDRNSKLAEDAGCYPVRKYLSHQISIGYWS